MKSLGKGIIVIIVLVGVVVFSLTNNKKELKTILENKKLAVFIQDEDGSYETVNQIPRSGYKLNTDKSICNNGVTPTWSNNTLNLANLTSNNTNCYLYFDKLPAASNTILENITVNENTPDFSQVATTDEGVFKAEDPVYNGTSYYWRGAVTNNYVMFAGKCWRIIRINGDGSIRLIYDGSTCHANGVKTTDSTVANIVYNTTSNNSSYVGWTYTVNSQRPTPTTGGTASNAKTQLESWFNSTITGTDLEKVADGKYCNDRNTKDNEAWRPTGSTQYYAAYQRLAENKTPTLSCSSEDVYTLKVGLITADEVAYAGGKYGSNNTSYYLYNGHYYWTMSPDQWYSYNSYANVFCVDDNGYLNNANVISTTRGLRPVINLKSNTAFSLGGNGTLDNPYVVEGA